jgi:hypothetical protein
VTLTVSDRDSPVLVVRLSTTNHFGVRDLRESYAKATRE